MELNNNDQSAAQKLEQAKKILGDNTSPEVSANREIEESMRRISEQGPFSKGLGGESETDFTRLSSEERESFSDQGVTYMQGKDNEEERALNQGSLEKWGNGLTKALGIAATSTLENTAGLVYGLGAALVNGVSEGDVGTGVSSYYDNTFTRGLDSFNEMLRENMPHYYTKAEQDYGLLRSMGTNNFWSDKFLNGAGFMAGALATGYGLSKFMAISKLASTGGRVAALEESMAMTAEKIREIASSIKFKNSADFLKNAAVMSLGESAVEARGIKDAVREKLLANLEEQGITNPTEQQLQEIEDAAEAAGNVGFATNLAITGATNALQFGKMLGPGYKGNKIALNTMREDLEATAKAGRKQFAQDAGSKGWDTAKRVAEGVLEEGSQEGLQFTTEKAMTDYYGRRFSEDGPISMAQAAVDALGETLTTKEGLESVLLGALLGGPMGAVTSRGEYDARKSATEKVVDLRNNPQLEKLKQKIEGSQAVASYQKDKDKALEKGDVHEYKNLEYEENTEFIKNVIESGATEVMLEQLEASKGMSEEEFKKAFGYDPNYKLSKPVSEIIQEKQDQIESLSKVYENIQLAFPTPNTKDPEKLKKHNVHKSLLWNVVSQFPNLDERETKISDEIAKITGSTEIASAARNMINFDYGDFDAYYEAYRQETEDPISYDEFRKKSKENYGKEFKKAIEAFAKRNPAKADEVLALTKDLARLAARREKFIRAYNDLTDNKTKEPIVDAVIKSGEEKKADRLSDEESKKAFREKVLSSGYTEDDIKKGNVVVEYKGNKHKVTKDKDGEWVIGGRKIKGGLLTRVDYRVVSPAELKQEEERRAAEAARKARVESIERLIAIDDAAVKKNLEEAAKLEEEILTYMISLEELNKYRQGKDGKFRRVGVTGSKVYTFEDMQRAKEDAQAAIDLYQEALNKLTDRRAKLEQSQMYLMWELDHLAKDPRSLEDIKSDLEDTLVNHEETTPSEFQEAIDETKDLISEIEAKIESLNAYIRDLDEILKREDAFLAYVNSLTEEQWFKEKYPDAPTKPIATKTRTSEDDRKERIIFELYARKHPDFIHDLYRLEDMREESQIKADNEKFLREEISLSKESLEQLKSSITQAKERLRSKKEGLNLAKRYELLDKNFKRIKLNEERFIKLIEEAQSKKVEKEHQRDVEKEQGGQDVAYAAPWKPRAKPVWNSSTVWHVKGKVEKGQYVDVRDGEGKVVFTDDAAQVRYHNTVAKMAPLNAKTPYYLEYHTSATMPSIFSEKEKEFERSNKGYVGIKAVLVDNTGTPVRATQDGEISDKGDLVYTTLNTPEFAGKEENGQWSTTLDENSLMSEYAAIKYGEKGRKPSSEFVKATEIKIGDKTIKRDDLLKEAIQWANENTAKFRNEVAARISKGEKVYTRVQSKSHGIPNRVGRTPDGKRQKRPIVGNFVSSLKAIKEIFVPTTVREEEGRTVHPGVPYVRTTDNKIIDTINRTLDKNEVRMVMDLLHYALNGVGKEKFRIKSIGKDGKEYFWDIFPTEGNKDFLLGKLLSYGTPKDGKKTEFDIYFDRGHLHFGGKKIAPENIATSEELRQFLANKYVQVKRSLLGNTNPKYFYFHPTSFDSKTGVVKMKSYKSEEGLGAYESFLLEENIIGTDIVSYKSKDEPQFMSSYLIFEPKILSSIPTSTTAKPKDVAKDSAEQSTVIPATTKKTTTKQWKKIDPKDISKGDKVSFRFDYQGNDVERVMIIGGELLENIVNGQDFGKTESALRFASNINLTFEEGTLHNLEGVVVYKETEVQTTTPEAKPEEKKEPVVNIQSQPQEMTEEQKKKREERQARRANRESKGKPSLPEDTETERGTTDINDLVKQAKEEKTEGTSRPKGIEGFIETGDTVWYKGYEYRVDEIDEARRNYLAESEDGGTTDSEGDITLAYTISDNDGPIFGVKAEDLVLVKKGDPTKNSKSSPFRLKTSNVYEQADLTKEQAWFAERFSIPFNIVKNLIQGKAFGQFKEAAVYIYENAEVGTTYHEAFHAVTHMFLTPTERAGLYKELRNRAGSTTTFKGETKKYADLTKEEAEEFLAEEFREYVMSDGKMKIPQPKQASFFGRLWNAIKELFFGPVSIETVYDKILKGAYKSAKVPFTTRMRNFFKKNKSVDKKWRSLTEGQRRELTEGVNALFFSRLFSEGTAEQLFTKTGLATQIYEDTYDLVLDHIEDAMFTADDKGDFKKAEDLQDIIELVENYWDEIVEMHKDYVKQFGIEFKSNKINEDAIDQTAKAQTEPGESEDEFDIEDGKNNFTESYYFNTKDGMPRAVKMLIASLPQVTYNEKTGKYDKPKLSSIGLPSLVDFDKTYNHLAQNLAGTPADFSLFRSKIQELAETRPELERLLRRVGESSVTSTRQEENLRTQLVQTFGKAKYDFFLGLIKDGGDIIFIDSNANKLQSKIIEGWRSRMRDSLPSKEGKLYIPKNLMDNINWLLERDKIEEAYSKLGIVFDNASVLEGDISSGKEGVKTTAKEILQNIIKFGIKGDMSDIFSSSSDVKGSIDTLANLATSVSNEVVELQHINAEGKTVYGVTLNSYLTLLANTINQYAGNRKALEENVPHMFSLFTENSLFKERILNGEKVTIDIIEGLKSDERGSVGTVTKELTASDRYATQVAAVLRGYYPFLRSADRGTENSFRVGGGPLASSEDEAISRMKLYLLDEINTSRALIHDGVGEDIEYYKGSARDLRVFKEILKDINYSDVLNKANFTKNDLRDFIESKEVTNAIRSFFRNEVAEEKKAMDEFELLRTTKKDNKVVYAGFSEDIVSQYESIDDMIANYVWNNMLAMIEQSKIFVGDPAFFKLDKEKQPVDFFKRTAMFNSTKKISRIDNAFNAWLDGNSPRLFEEEKVGKGKPADGKIETLIIEDVKVRSNHAEALEALFKDSFEGDGFSLEEAASKARAYSKKYIGMDEADAQGYITMDEYKEFMERAGDWTEAHQNLYEKLARKEKISAEEIFYFQPLKGQYTGPQDYTKDVKGKEARLYVPTGYKFSLMPLIPQMLEDRNLSDLNDYMLSNHIGLAMYTSANKFGTRMRPRVEGDPNSGKTNKLYKDGLIDLDNPVTQTVDYRYFGIQLDIAPKVKTKNTAGTQQRKLILSNMFSGGVPIDYKKSKGDWDALSEQEKLNTSKVYRVVTEYNDVQKRIIQKSYEDLKKFLGLQWNGEKYVVGDAKRLVEFLVKSSTERGGTDNLKDSIQQLLVRTPDGKYELNMVDGVLARGKVESLLMSLVNNRVISEKRFGGAKPQAASTGFEKKGVKRMQKDGMFESGDLNFYGLKYDKSGKLVGVESMEVMIPLPAALIEYVDEEFGSLQAFNDAIARKDSRIDPRILEVVGYRIPTQAFNSIDKMVVKEFLPPYAGDIIVVPSEIVAKVGSDFDIDKENLYLANYKTKREADERDFGSIEFLDFVKDYMSKQGTLPSLEVLLDEEYEVDTFFAERINRARFTNQEKAHAENNITLHDLGGNYDDLVNVKKAIQAYNQSKKEMKNKLEYVEYKGKDDTSLAGMQNRMLELQLEILSMPENARQLLSPISDDLLKNDAKKGLVDEVRKLDKSISSIKETFTDIFKGRVNLRKAIYFLSGKMGVSQVAVHITGHTMAQLANLYVKRDVKLFFDHNEVTIDGQTYPSLGKAKDVKGNLISETLSAFMNAYVDIAKDPYIFDLNAGNETANTIMYMLRLGVDPHWLARFMTQPIIRDYIKKTNINKSQIIKAKELDIKNSDIIKNLIREYSKGTSYRGDYKKFISNLERDNSAGLMQSKIDEIASDYKKFSVEDLNSLYTKQSTGDYAQAQIQLLDNFLEYSRQSKSFQKSVRASSPDTKGTGKNMNTLRSIIDEREEVLSEGFVGNFDKMFSETFMGVFEEVVRESYETFRDHFVTEDEKYGDTLRRMKAAVSAGKFGRQAERARDTVNNDFVIYSLMTAETKGKLDIKEAYNRLFIGSNSIPRRVMKIKSDVNHSLYNNPIISEFMGLLSDDLTKHDNLRIFSRKLATYKSNELTSAFEEIFDINPILGEDLIKFGLAQSGLGYSHLSYVELIPARHYFNMVNPAIQYMKENNVDIADFEDQFYRNNIDLLPTGKMKEFGGIYSPPYWAMSYSSYEAEAQYPYLKKYKMTKKKDGTTEFEMQLWKRGEERNGYYTYSYDETHQQLGDGNKLKWYVKGEAVNKAEESKPAKERVLPQIAKDTNVGEVFYDEQGNLVERISLEEYRKYSKVPESISGVKVRVRQRRVAKPIPGADLRTESATNWVYERVKGFVTNTLTENSKITILSIEENENEDDQFQLDSKELEGPNNQLNSRIQSFLSLIGVDVKAVDSIPGGAVARARILKKIVEIVEGKADITTLPEEAAHFLVEALGVDHPTVKAMMRVIEMYDVYDEVIRDYSEAYNGDVNKLKKEAVGKLIAQRIVKQWKEGDNSTPKVERANTWFKALWAKIKEMFKRLSSSQIDGALKEFDDAARMILNPQEISNQNDLSNNLDKSEIIGTFASISKKELDEYIKHCK